VIPLGAMMTDESPSLRIRMVLAAPVAHDVENGQCGPSRVGRLSTE
jgi:hypothetical protein